MVAISSGGESGVEFVLVDDAVDWRATEGVAVLEISRGALVGPARPLLMNLSTSD